MKEVSVAFFWYLVYMVMWNIIFVIFIPESKREFDLFIIEEFVYRWCYEHQMPPEPLQVAWSWYCPVLLHFTAISPTGKTHPFQRPSIFFQLSQLYSAFPAWLPVTIITSTTKTIRVVVIFLVMELSWNERKYWSLWKISQFVYESWNLLFKAKRRNWTNRRERTKVIFFCQSGSITSRSLATNKSLDFLKLRQTLLCLTVVRAPVSDCTLFELWSYYNLIYLMLYLIIILYTIFLWNF